VYDNNANDLYIAKVSKNGISWSGPHVNESTNFEVGGAYSNYMQGAISQRTSSTSVDRVVSFWSRVLVDSRTRHVETGAIARFGHDIICDRIHLEYKRYLGSIPVTFTFTFPDETTQSFTFNTLTQASGLKYEKVVLVPPVRIRDRWFKVKVSVGASTAFRGVMGRLKDVTLELKTVPRMHE
jgi:hypothetical protein